MTKTNNKIERIAISSKIYQELFKEPKFRVMFYLQDHGEVAVYDMAKELRWTISKTHNVVKKLIKSKIIYSEIRLENGRTKKYINFMRDKINEK